MGTGGAFRGGDVPVTVLTWLDAHRVVIELKM